MAGVNAQQQHPSLRRRLDEDGLAVPEFRSQIVSLQAHAETQAAAFRGMEQARVKGAQVVELKAEIRIKDVALAAKDAILQATIQGKEMPSSKAKTRSQGCHSASNHTRQRDAVIEGKNALLQAKEAEIQRLQAELARCGAEAAPAPARAAAAAHAPAPATFPPNVSSAAADLMQGAVVIDVVGVYAAVFAVVAVVVVDVVRGAVVAGAVAIVVAAAAACAYVLMCPRRRHHCCACFFLLFGKKRTSLFARRNPHTAQ